MTWSPDMKQGYDSDKIKYLIVPYTRGRGLDLGCGKKTAYPHFIGVDNGSTFGKGGASVMVGTCEDLSIFGNESMDFVFSSHLLEHIENTRAALTEWWRVIKTGGHLVLYLPHKDFYPNCGQPGANADHKHDFVPSDILSIMHEIGGVQVVENEERNDGDEYSFYQVFEKLGPKWFLSQWPKPEKTVCICRFGGFGDMLQMSSILPGLKAQGYHVTVMTTPKGKEPIANDPNVDAWIIQDTDQVPNEELLQYWAEWQKRFDKFINLSESVEATALAYPGRPAYFWNKEAREYVYGNINYLRIQHAIAGVKYKPAVRFYPTSEETHYAETIRIVAGGRPIVLWSLAGSSFHKAYPWTDNVVAKLILETNAFIVFTGDIACKILECGWENEPRCLSASGEWSIRESLAVANIADVVVGPETGILNSVSYLPGVAKVIMLSHSSKENLCADWVNTTVLTPQECPCYPCHMMHLTKNSCHEDEETGASLCAAKIAPGRVYDAINRTLKKRRKA